MQEAFKKALEEFDKKIKQYPNDTTHVCISEEVDPETPVNVDINVLFDGDQVIASSCRAAVCVMIKDGKIVQSCIIGKYSLADIMVMQKALQNTQTELVNNAVAQVAESLLNTLAEED